MLYVTTRNKSNAHTAAHAWGEKKSEEGLYAPFRVPVLTAQQIYSLGERSFGQNVADILNLFYPCKLTAWDVDFAIGRSPARAVGMSHRIIVVELWHNLERTYCHTVQSLADLVLNRQGAPVSQWAQIAVRIATLFGVFGEMQRQGIWEAGQVVDVAIPTGDFTAPMAAWYARRMGLSIGRIICACNDNSAAWELLHQGSMHTDMAVVSTNTPVCDFSTPPAMELLIHEALGSEEVTHYASVCEKGRIYQLKEEQRASLQHGMYSAVISKLRIPSSILSLYRNAQYIASPYTALAYSGLMDYRARTGESRTALILAEHAPESDSQTVADSLHVSTEQLADMLFKG